jgi:hypothetical protein
MKRLVLALGIFIAVAAVASAEDDGGFGLGVGMVKVKDSDSSQLWLTANVRWMLADNLALEPEIGWFRATGSGDDHTDVFNGGGSVLLILPAQKVDLFAGVGLGAHMYRDSSAGVTNTNTYLGYHGLAGVDLHASRGISLFGAVRYEIISIGSGLDSLKQFKLYGGLRFRSH